MKTLALAVGLAAALAAASSTVCAAERSRKALAEFKRAHVCPSTGLARARACPGYVVDHITPLCAGGADAPWNMQYQSIAEGKRKDREERALCRRLKERRL